MRWREEIEDLHNYFHAYFSGAETSSARLEESLAAGFTIVGPSGDESNREQIIAAIMPRQGHDGDLRISTRDHQLIKASDDSIVASYIEVHHTPDETTVRRSTAVFLIDPNGPNGLRWLRVHETWI